MRIEGEGGTPSDVPIEQDGKHVTPLADDKYSYYTFNSNDTSGKDLLNLGKSIPQENTDITLEQILAEKQPYWMTRPPVNTNDNVPAGNYEAFTREMTHAATELSNPEQEVLFGRPFDKLQTMLGYQDFVSRDSASPVPTSGIDVGDTPPRMPVDLPVDLPIEHS